MIVVDVKIHVHGKAKIYKVTQYFWEIEGSSER